MLPYLEQTLETEYYETAIVHVGVNDLLSGKSPNKTDKFLISSLVNIVMECKSFGRKNLFFVLEIAVN